MPNNIKWYIGHDVDIWSYAAGKTLRYRLNVLAGIVADIGAVLKDEKKTETKKGKRTLFGEEMANLETMVTILRGAYFPALETNPYIPHLRANYEMAMDILERRIKRILNRENMVASSMMQEAMTSFGMERRRLAKVGGDAR